MEEGENEVEDADVHSKADERDGDLFQVAVDIGLFTFDLRAEGSCVVKQIVDGYGDREADHRAG